MKHGLSNTRTYRLWYAMKQNKARIIEAGFTNKFREGDYDPRWEDFEEFYADMGLCPPKMTLFQYDRKKPLSKDNCAWALRHKYHRRQLRKHNIRVIVYAPITNWRARNIYDLS